MLGKEDGGPYAPAADDMEGKYKQRLMSAGRPADGDGLSLKEQYEEKEKKELVVQKSAVMKLSQVYTAVVRTVMAALALVGGVSLARPELRQVLAGILLEAVREIKGF